MAIEDYLEKDDIKLLIDIAFEGCSKGKVADSRAVFSNLLIANPELVAAKIGQAFSHIVVDEFSEADGILEEVLAKDNANDDARGFLVLSKSLQKNTDEVDRLMTTFVDKSSSGYQLALNLVNS